MHADELDLDAVPPLPGASNVVLIDNYDSFTYNLYAFLELEGAKVTVYRNDEVTLHDLILFEPTQLVVSPGPGNPEEDAGISKDAIRYFAGKVPVLGVCMGEQCLFTVFGGKVEVTGEILHGKTSPLRHDSKGLFAGLAQDLPVTRYHSLAGTHSSLPDCLVVSAWIASGPDGSKGIIMGVRHKELVVEGVQFHPESILSSKGRQMLRNFLRMRGGSWNENLQLQGVPDESKATALSTTKGHEHLDGTNKTSPVKSSNQSILDDIFEKRRAAIEVQKEAPSFRPSDLQAYYDLNLAPPQVSFPERLRQSPFVLSLMAEVKRASPSKGDIAPDICAPAQAKKYALAGASVISVLTEPEYFKGSLDDMRAVRRMLEGMPMRPAVLRKDFIFEKYQILEARLAGADSVLLIVKMLSQDLLDELYLYSQSLGMEPLVEVNTVEEMKIAINLGSKVIGVNNRDLTNFQVDLDTTNRLMEGVPISTTVCALSGISVPQDVVAYRKNRVSAVLVGEALMRAENIDAFVDHLFGSSSVGNQSTQNTPVKVKICGTRTAKAARVAITAGADMIGIILVEGRSRCVTREAAIEISNIVHTTPKEGITGHVNTNLAATAKASDYFDHSAQFLSREDRALLVGVFRNQPLSYILHQQRSLNLDIVQLHGSEPVEWASLIPVPVVRRFAPDDPGIGLTGYHAMPLLDSAMGGTGQSIDIEAVQATLKANGNLKVVLAGGLNPKNITKTLAQLQKSSHQVVALDVSSGVEEGGVQNHQKIIDFITAAKARTRC
ncbi:MAG: hypothetical protein Q9163_002958 [Psora crenata]